MLTICDNPSILESIRKIHIVLMKLFLYERDDEWKKSAEGLILSTLVRQLHDSNMTKHPGKVTIDSRQQYEDCIDYFEDQAFIIRQDKLAKMWKLVFSGFTEKPAVTFSELYRSNVWNCEDRDSGPGKYLHLVKQSIIPPNPPAGTPGGWKYCGRHAADVNALLLGAYEASTKVCSLYPQDITPQFFHESYSLHEKEVSRGDRTETLGDALRGIEQLRLVIRCHAQRRKQHLEQWSKLADYVSATVNLTTFFIDCLGTARKEDSFRRIRPGVTAPRSVEKKSVDPLPTSRRQNTLAKFKEPISQIPHNT